MKTLNKGQHAMLVPLKALLMAINVRDHAGIMRSVRVVSVAPMIVIITGHTAIYDADGNCLSDTAPMILERAEQYAADLLGVEWPQWWDEKEGAK